MELFAPRYMTRFACTGPQCPDSCCHSWGVLVDRAHYDVLREKMDTNDADREEFLRSVKVLENSPNKQHQFALMVLQDNGKGHRDCSMLDNEGLCKVHGRYGEEALSDTCSQYPRIAGRLGNRGELVGSSSCPEVARLFLLGDNALDIVPAEREHFGRGLINRAIDEQPTDDYGKSFVPVRNVLMGLARAKPYPISSRLVFIAFFADKARAWLVRRGTAFDAQKLFELMRAIRDANLLNAIQSQFDEMIVASPFGFSVVRELLTIPTKQMPESLDTLVDDAFEFLGLDLDSEAELLQVSFLEKAAKLSPRLRARADHVIERYVQQFILREWFILTPSLIQYVMGALARVAVVRFLLLAQPSVVAIAAREDDEAVALFDAVAVRVVYSLSRMIEHDHVLAEKLLADLDEQQMTQLSHAICLIKVDTI